MTTLVLKEGHSSTEARLYCYDASEREIGNLFIPYGREPDMTKLPAGTMSIKIIPIIDMDI